MKNIELKVKINKFHRITEILKNNGAQFKGIMSQTDTYYHCRHGRLKLREIDNNKFQLIFYLRGDKKNSKKSDYYILNFTATDAAIAKKILKMSLLEKIVVKKRRALWMLRHTRVHMDTVVGLGNFIELETEVKKNSLSRAYKEHDEIIGLLGLEGLVKCSQSYSDILLRKK